MNYKDFFKSIYEDCNCNQDEGYPWGGFNATKSDFDNPLGKKDEVKYPHKRRDPMGQEDADINNDGKVDLTDKMLRAKRDLYKKYLLAKKKGQKSI